jgi:hypothetical protein
VALKQQIKELRREAKEKENELNQKAREAKKMNVSQTL